jgi:hypothetical protein
MKRMKQVRNMVVALWAAASVWAQTAAPPPDLLVRFHAQMLENMSRQPNYTCLETVERSRQLPGNGVLMKDTLRLEVALVNGKEMFAWPGSKQFEDKNIRELVPIGMFGNGNYGLYARMLFGGAGPAFEYKEQTLLAGNAVVRFDFRVPQAISGYELSVDKHRAVVGFHGSIFVDPADVDLRRLEVYADDIPADLGLTAAEDRVDYARLTIGEEKFLLPVESSLLMASKTTTSRNLTRFSGCRKFAGESSLIFDESELRDEADAIPAPAVVAEVALPRNTELAIEIRSDLSLENAAVGDVVTGLLKSDVKSGKQVLIRKGATATGRISLLERLTGYTLLKVEFHELEWAGGHASFGAHFDRMGSTPMAGRGRFYYTTDGTLQFLSPLPRTLRGDVWVLKTVE